MCMNNAFDFADVQNINKTRQYSWIPRNWNYPLVMLHIFVNKQVGNYLYSQICIYEYFDTSLPKLRNGNSMGHGKKCNENSNLTKRLLMVSCKPQKNATEECKPVE